MIKASPFHGFSFNNTRVDVYHANKGEGIPKHTHFYNHITMCSSGSCVVKIEGKEVIMTKNTKPVNLIGSKWHEIEALEDGTVFVNIFAEEK